MTKIELETSKLYYGFPIFILGYKDQKWGYNYTTSSSSYTLGSELNIGLSSHSNAAKQISKNGCFTLNIPSEKQMKQIKIGGFNSGADKFNFPNSFHYEKSDLIDAPVITECCLTLECEVTQIIESGTVSHIFSTIKRWLVEDTLLDEQQLSSLQLNPVFYMGDSHERIFRYLSK